MGSNGELGEFEWLGEIWRVPLEKERLNLTHRDPMRRISFAQVFDVLNAGGVLDVVRHTSRPNQMVIVIAIRGYAYGVPVLWEDRFVKNVIPSRTLTKRYLASRRQEE